MTDFQRQAGVQGEAFEEAVVFLLLADGWEIVSRKTRYAQAEVDIVARHPDTKEEWWIECKGSYRGKVPGARRGDTTKKACGVAWYLSTLPNRRPYMLITSHLPVRGTQGDLMLNAALAAGIFAQVRATGFGDRVLDDEDDE